MPQTPPDESRRSFLKSAGLGAFLGGSGLTIAGGAPAGRAAPDLVRGEVVRTGGALLEGGGWLREAEREIPVAGAVDVLVCGGGPAGVAAALAAARAGAKVRLIELNGCLGGIWTAGLLTKILDAGNKGGIMAELLAAFAAQGGRVAKRSGGTVYDPEVAKRVLEDLLVGAGVEILLHTRVVGAVLRGGGRRIAAVLTESKSGRQAWVAERFVDCTGDGDLAAQAGCGFEVGTGAGCTCQPMSMLALLAGIDPRAVARYVREDNPASSKPDFLKLMEENGIAPSYRAPTLRHLHSGIFSIMTNHEYGVPAFDADAISQATVRARREIHDIVGGLRKLGGIWADLSVVATAEQIGIREGRRIRGRYEVTLDDLAAGLKHEQAVCTVKFGIDVHALDQAGAKQIDQTWKGRGMRPYDIPYPALVAADVDGLLMAGRCISGDFVAHSSYRVTGNSVPMGEAAGLAAAVSIRMGALPHELTWAQVQAVGG